MSYSIKLIGVLTVVACGLVLSACTQSLTKEQLASASDRKALVIVGHYGFPKIKYLKYCAGGCKDIYATDGDNDKVSIFSVKPGESFNINNVVITDGRYAKFDNEQALYVDKPGLYYFGAIQVTRTKVTISRQFFSQVIYDAADAFGPELEMRNPVNFTWPTESELLSEVKLLIFRDREFVAEELLEKELNDVQFGEKLEEKYLYAMLFEDYIDVNDQNNKHLERVYSFYKESAENHFPEAMFFYPIFLHKHGLDLLNNNIITSPAQEAEEALKLFEQAPFYGSKSAIFALCVKDPLTKKISISRLKELAWCDVAIKEPLNYSQVQNEKIKRYIDYYNEQLSAEQKVQKSIVAAHYLASSNKNTYEAPQTDISNQ